MFSQDLEKVRKDVQDLTVKEAVAKNAFEKSAKTGKDQVSTINYEINKKLLVWHQKLDGYQLSDKISLILN